MKQSKKATPRISVTHPTANVVYDYRIYWYHDVKDNVLSYFKDRNWLLGATLYDSVEAATKGAEARIANHQAPYPRYKIKSFRKGAFERDRK